MSLGDLIYFGACHKGYGDISDPRSLTHHLSLLLSLALALALKLEID